MLLANVDSMKISEDSNNHIISAIVLQLLSGTSERVKTQWIMGCFFSLGLMRNQWSLAG